MLFFFKIRNNYTNNLLRRHCFTYWHIQKLGSNVICNLSLVSMPPIVSALGSFYFSKAHTLFNLTFWKSDFLLVKFLNLFPLVICKREKDWVHSWYTFFFFFQITQLFRLHNQDIKNLWSFMRLHFTSECSNVFVMLLLLCPS